MSQPSPIVVHRNIVTVIVMLYGLISTVHAKSLDATTLACLEKQFFEAPPETTLASVRARCQSDEPIEESTTEVAQPNSLLLARMEREREVDNFRSTLTPHNRNYMIPVSYMAEPNEAPFNDLGPPGGDDVMLDNVEAKFQVSIKTMLLDHLFAPDDALYFAFTATSFWQVYNTDISSPFRETNYEPELFWAKPVSWGIFGADAMFMVLGASHQSNGQSGTLSRSWNRLYANLVWEKGGLVLSFKPWYRLPEDAKNNPSDASGDDNPDITEYMGHFEIGGAYRRGDHEFTVMARNNLRSDNTGAIQLEWTFPLLKNVKGYAQYFNGYGESLIDYNARIERIGVGILLTDLL